MERPIYYEPHPITPERKAELVAQGYRIVDAKFAPADIPASIRIAKQPDPKPIPPAIEDHEEVAAFIDEAFSDMVPEAVEAPKPRRGRKKKAK